MNRDSAAGSPPSPIRTVSLEPELRRERLPWLLLETAQFLTAAILSVGLYGAMLGLTLVAISIAFQGDSGVGALELPAWVFYAAGSIPLFAAALALVALLFHAARNDRSAGLAGIAIVNPVLIGASASAIGLVVQGPGGGLPFSMPFRILSLVILAGGPFCSVTGAAWLLLLRRRRPPAAAESGPSRWPLMSITLAAARYGAVRPRLLYALLRSAASLLLHSLLFLLGTLLLIAAGVIAAELLRKRIGLPDGDFGMILSALCSIVAALLVTAAGAGWVLVRGRRSPLIASIILAIALVSILATLRHIEQMIGPALWSGRPIAEPAATVPLDLRDAVMVFMLWAIIAMRRLISRPIQAAGRRIRLALARTASELAGQRPEPPIVLLRAFEDDRQSVPLRNSAMADALGLAADRIRLEEIVSQIMFARGPLVAFSDPSAASDPIGAARDRVADDGWRERVVSYLERADIVIGVFAATPSFVWELDQVMALGKLERTILILPPDHLRTRLLVRDSPRLASALGLADARDEAARLAGARALAFDSSCGTFTAFTSIAADSAAYREAILRCALLVAASGPRPQIGPTRGETRLIPAPVDERPRAGLTVSAGLRAP